MGGGLKRTIWLRRSLGNQHGLSLVQIIIAFGILMGVIAAGMNLTSSMNSMELRTAVLLRAVSARESLIAMVKNDDAWRYTILVTNNNLPPYGTSATPRLDCLREDSDCRNSSGVDMSNQDTVFLLRSAQDSTYYNALNNSIGFRLNIADPTSTTCGTFATSGTNWDCPIRYNLRWRAVCLSSGTCMRPRVLIKGTFQVNSLLLNIQKARYDFEFIRGGSGSDTILLRFEDPTGIGGGNGAAAVNNGTQNRLFTRPATSDVGGNILAYSGGDGVTTADSVQLRAGQYECEFSAPAWKVNGHKASLINVTDSNAVLIEGDTAYAASGSSSDFQTRSSGRGKFTLTVDSYVALQHFTASSSGSASELGYAAGAEVSALTPGIHAILKCFKED